MAESEAPSDSVSPTSDPRLAAVAAAIEAEVDKRREILGSILEECCACFREKYNTALQQALQEKQPDEIRPTEDVLEKVAPFAEERTRKLLRNHFRLDFEFKSLSSRGLLGNNPEKPPGDTADREDSDSDGSEYELPFGNFPTRPNNDSQGSASTASSSTPDTHSADQSHGRKVAVVKPKISRANSPTTTRPAPSFRVGSNSAEARRFLPSQRPGAVASPFPFSSIRNHGTSLGNSSFPSNLRNTANNLINIREVSDIAIYNGEVYFASKSPNTVSKTRRELHPNIPMEVQPNIPMDIKQLGTINTEPTESLTVIDASQFILGAWVNDLDFKISLLRMPSMASTEIIQSAGFAASDYCTFSGMIHVISAIGDLLSFAMDSTRNGTLEQRFSPNVFDMCVSSVRAHYIIAACFKDQNRVEIFDSRENCVVTNFQVRNVTRVASPNPTIIITGSTSGSVKLWTRQTSGDFVLTQRLCQANGRKLGNIWGLCATPEEIFALHRSGLGNSTLSIFGRSDSFSTQTTHNSRRVVDHEVVNEEYSGLPHYSDED